MKMFSKKAYVEISKAKIKDKRNIVISRIDDTENYVVAQQAVTEVDGKQSVMFIKGAIFIESLESMYNLRDALNEAISKEEDRKQ
jgi:hypothetical protein